MSIIRMRGKAMKKDKIEKFEKLHIQIKDMYNELSILSKKSPDGAMNKFKLKFINQLIEESNQFLEEKYKPFDDFKKFEEDDIPFNSDVVLIVSQYIQCLEKFKYDNIKQKSGSWYWNLSDSQEEVKTSRPISEFTF